MDCSYEYFDIEDADDTKHDEIVDELRLISTREEAEKFVRDYPDYTEQVPLKWLQYIKLGE